MNLLPPTMNLLPTTMATDDLSACNCPIFHAFRACFSCHEGGRRVYLSVVIFVVAEGDRFSCYNCIFLLTSFYGFWFVVVSPAIARIGYCFLPQPQADTGPLQFCLYISGFLASDCDRYGSSAILFISNFLHSDCEFSSEGWGGTTFFLWICSPPNSELWPRLLLQVVWYYEIRLVIGFLYGS